VWLFRQANLNHRLEAKQFILMPRNSCDLKFDLLFDLNGTALGVFSL